MSRRGGFTFIELLMVVTIIGILSAVAVPKFRDVKRRASATQIIGDVDVIRHAAMSFYADSGYYPGESDAAVVPPNMTQYLPAGFSMTRPQWTVDYENWSLETPRPGIAIGVSFITEDPALGQTAMRLAGNTPAYTMGSKFTFLIVGF